MSTNVNTVTNHYPSPQNGFTTTTSGSVGSGAATVGLNSVAGYTNGQIIVLVIDPTDASKKQTFTGVVDTAGVQVTGVKWTAGTNQTHALGATVVDYATATHIGMITKGLLSAGLTQAGGMGAIAPTSVASTGAVSGTTGTFSGNVSENGQTLQTIRSETSFDYVASGCVWSGDAYGSTRNASMTAGAVYIGGKRVAVSLVTARSFTASKDTYIDVDNAGTITYNEVNNNAASPALAANSIRLGIIVTDGTDIQDAGSVNQGQESKVLPIASSIAYSVTDSLGNLICPRDPNRRILGYRQYTSNVTTTSASLGDITGLSLNVIVPEGRKVRVSAKDGEYTRHSITGSGVSLATYDATAAVVIEERATSAPGVNFAFNNSIVGKPYTPPSSGVRNFKAQFGKTIATGTIIASATAPITFIVELV